MYILEITANNGFKMGGGGQEEEGLNLCLGVGDGEAGNKVRIQASHLTKG